jgi:hypothetical protein
MIRFKSAFNSVSMGIEVPELTLIVNQVIFQKNTNMYVSIFIQKFASVDAYTNGKNPLTGGELQDIVSIVDTDENFNAYFSAAAIAAADGDIILQASKYYREIVLLGAGVPLVATEII